MPHSTHVQPPTRTVGSQSHDQVRDRSSGSVFRDFQEGNTARWRAVAAANAPVRSGSEEIGLCFEVHSLQKQPQDSYLWLCQLPRGIGTQLLGQQIQSAAKVCDSGGKRTVPSIAPDFTHSPKNSNRA